MFAERYGITLHCSPGGSHRSLGGVERHHYQLRHTVELLLEADDTLSLQDACDVACMSLNYHPMPDRSFLPQQLVYGVSSHWPDFVAAKLPTLAETPVPSDHVGHYMVKFLDAMYRAREKFQAADVRAKVSLAKRSRPSTNRKVELLTGNTVFYFESLEKGKDSWHGPAVVIGADGDFVVLRHGGCVRRVPLLHCTPASAVLGSHDVDPEVAPVAVPDEAQQELEELHVDQAGNELSAEEVAELRRVRDDREPVVTRSRARAAMSVLTRLGPGLPELVWQRYTSVIPPAISGEVFLSYCYVAHRSARCGMREVTPERAQSLDFVAAKQKELVPDNGQKAIWCRLVLVDKVQDDCSLKPKARLVVPGFQEAGLRDLDTFSPTCSKSPGVCCPQLLLIEDGLRSLWTFPLPFYKEAPCSRRCMYGLHRSCMHRGRCQSCRRRCTGSWTLHCTGPRRCTRLCCLLVGLWCRLTSQYNFFRIMRTFVGGQPFTLTISPSLGLILSSHPFWRRCTVSSLLGLKIERSMCFVDCIWNANVTMTAI